MAAVIFFADAASAQSLKDIFKSKKAQDVIGAVAGTVVGSLQEVSLTGDWTYGGVAVGLEGDNTVANLAGSAAAGAIDSKVDEMLAKVGITAGSISFSFKGDSTFVCKFKEHPLSGTWSQNGSNITLSFGKVMKSLKMQGTVKATTNGCEMLFTSEKFMVFLKNALSTASKLTNSEQLSAVADLLDNYDNVLLGCKLTK